MAQRQTTLIGVLVAIAITAALDFSGYSAFSALPLFPLLLLFARLEGLSRRELGFTLGRPGPYLLALLHPLAVLGVIAALAAQGGAIDASATDWRKAMLNCASSFALSVAPPGASGTSHTFIRRSRKKVCASIRSQTGHALRKLRAASLH